MIVFLFVCSLMLSAPTVLLGFLLRWTWDISSWQLQQSAAAAPYLGREVAPLSCHPWPWTCCSSSWTHSCAMGDPKKWPLKGTLAFAKSRERTQNLLTFSPSGPSVGIRVSGTHAPCLSVASLSPVPLCLSPSGFLDDPYSTFHAHMISWREFWGSLWSRSFSYIQKPEGSKALLTFWRSPLTMLISQVGREPSFPHPWTS